MSDSEQDDNGSSIDEQEEVNENMRIFLRLRPMNKLETSKRSKNCVELDDDDPRCITVDSPLEGEYDFRFDHVFEEFASQDDVFKHAVAPVPEKLLKGYNCTVIAYGQTGSGKTHTMMGVNGGADGLLALCKRDKTREKLENVEGMILKTTKMIFEKIQESPPSIEYTIRCSYVEIYLEKILDLLNPSGGGMLSIVDDLPADEAAGVDDVNVLAGVRIAGAAELCCVDEADVYRLLARGNACRTISSTEMNTDSSRSHAIFVMTIEQNDKSTSKMTKSVLHMVDLAGSEMAATQSAAAQRSPGGASSVQTEVKMINKSFSVLNNVIRAQLENQRGAKHSVAVLSRLSKLTKFLRPSFGGNCMTTLLLTASPSSYNIGETMSTIRFGQRARRIHNPAVANYDFSCGEYRKRLKESEKRQMDQFHLLKALALECHDLKEQASKGTFEEEKHSGPLWKSIEGLIENNDQDDMDYEVSVRRRMANSDNDKVEAGDELENAQREIEKLREQLVPIRKAKDDLENQMLELQSEVAVLRSQNEHLIENKTKDMQELINAKNDLQIMSQRKIEVEHNFRTSQFRENEAIVFLRQFRRFYRNVLRDKMARGSGNLQNITKEISEKVSNAPDLTELVDVDALLLEAGLIEEHELHEHKTAPVYMPSKTALIRSRSAAQKAAKEIEVIGKELAAEVPEATGAIKSEEASEPVKKGAEPRRPTLPRRGSAIRRSSYNLVSVEPLDSEETKEESSSEAVDVKPSAGADAGAGSSPSAEVGRLGSTPLWDQSGLNITRRQQLLGTPSGRLATMREETVERELLEMANRCVELELALKEERATVELLSGRAGGLNKKQLAQEAIQLRQQVEKKTENLIAIAWKMNELNLINKAYNEKMVNLEQHVIYLEENYVELQNRNRVIIEDRQEAERKLREELDNLQKALGGMSVPLWQFNEEIPEKDRTFASRIVIPVYGGSRPSGIDTEPRPRRLSDAESEPSLGSQSDVVVKKVDVDTPSLGFPKDVVEIEKVVPNTQTEAVCTQDDEVQTDDVETDELGIQTDEIRIEVSSPMPKKASGDVLQTDTTGVQTDEQGVLDDSTSAGKEAAAGAVGATLGAATAGIVSRAVYDDVNEESNDVSAATAAVSRASDEDTSEVSHAIDAVDTIMYAIGKDASAISAGNPAAVTRAAAYETSKDSKAKNLFSRTSTVFSVLNRARSSVKESESAKPREDAEEIESYQGDGHAPKNVEEQDDMSDRSCSRDIWAAARDDFDFIVADTAKSVGTARRQVPGEDHKEVLNPDKSLSEFLDKAKTIGHKREDAFVTMGNRRSMLDEEEFGTVGEMVKPWEKGASSPKRKPWEEARTNAEEKKQSSKRDYGTSASSFDAFDDYLSDDASHDSVENESRNVAPRAPRKSHESTSDDEFDRMMTATQAALVAAEEIDDDVDSVSSVDSDPLVRPENQTMKGVASEDYELEGVVDRMASPKSQEDALFSGGRTNNFTPRRFVEKASTKIRAGVMKEEKKHHRTGVMKEHKDHHHHHHHKSSRDLGGKSGRDLAGKSSRELGGNSLEGKSSRDRMRKKSESRHESSVDDKKKKKKKESKKESKKTVSTKSSRDVRDRSKSERSPKREKDKERSRSKSRRRLSGEI